MLADRERGANTASGVLKFDLVTIREMHAAGKRP
jgi:hypothetical protein